MTRRWYALLVGTLLSSLLVFAAACDELTGDEADVDPVDPVERVAPADRDEAPDVVRTVTRTETTTPTRTRVATEVRPTTTTATTRVGREVVTATRTGQAEVVTVTQTVRPTQVQTTTRTVPVDRTDRPQGQAGARVVAVDIIRDPDRFRDQQATVTGRVTRVIAPRTFVLDNELLVVAETDAGATPTQGQQVQVSGNIGTFDLPAFRRAVGGTVDVAALREFNGQPVVEAQRVQPQ